MKTTKQIITLKRLNIFLIWLLFFFINCSRNSEEKVIIENRNFRYEIGSNGENLQFTDKTSGIDYLDHHSESFCANLTQDGKQIEVTSVSQKGRNLNLNFGSTGIIAVINIRKQNDRIIYKVVSVSEPVESLTFLNVPLKVEGMPYEPFAACVLSMNLFTHVRQIPALMTHLWAACYKRFGLEGAEVTLLGLPRQKILPVIRDVMLHAENVPHSDKGGAWALMQREGYGSYLMGTLTEETVDEYIKMCRSLGFNQIDLSGFRHGDFEVDTTKWRGGWDSFKRINARLHEAGISSIFHSYSFFIAKNSGYVTPVPSEDLGYFSSFTLAEPLKETDTEIIVNESTENVSVTTGFFVRNSVSLRIGSELIEFSGVTKTPPYKFTGCKRGANATKVSSFTKGEKVFHLREMFGRFVPNPETALFIEIAGKMAKAVSYCDFDGIYFDAIDGSDILGGDENFWYYGTKFIFEVAKQLKRPVGMEMSSMSHQWWHYRSRWQAWDKPRRGYKRFIDIHSAAIKSPGLFLSPKIKSNEYEHGLWRGHSPLIDKYAAIDNGGLQLPLFLGWWGYQTWNPPQAEPTFPDDIEYLCCKMTGNNAGLMLSDRVDDKILETIPLYRKLTGIIKQYEELRHQNYFNDTIRAILRQPGKEFTLFREDNGRWNFKPMAFKKHKIEGIDHPSSKWTVTNSFHTQPVKLRIEPLMSVKSFNDHSNVILADHSRPGEFNNEGSAEGVSGGIKPSAERPEGKGTGCLFSAYSKGLLPREGSWIKMEKKFEPWLDINKNQALGVWVKGDGNGQLLNLRIESPKHLSYGARGDHFIKIDFTGWKYFELVEIESSDFSNYIWPDSGLFLYDSYRHSVLFNSVDKLQIWYNNLPPGKEVSCTIGEIKALPLVPLIITDPTITIDGENLKFPVKMQSGMYLEFRSPEDCKLYGTRGELLQDVKIEGKVPLLKEGDNLVSFTCKGKQQVNQRFQVTVISEGKPLDNGGVFD